MQAEGIGISWILLAASCLTAAFVHGYSGFGFGILLMAQLALAGAGLERASVLTTLLAVTLTLSLWYQARRDLTVDWQAVGLLMCGVAAGLPVGYWFVYHYENQPVGRALFGIVLLTFAAQGWWKPGPRLRVPGWTGVLFGLVGGFLGGAYSSSGPPLVLYLYFREDDPRVAKRTLQVVFTLLGLYRVAVVLCGPRGIPAPMWLQAACALPFVAVGGLVGHRIFRRTRKESFVRAVYLVLASAGVVQLSRALF